MSFYRLLFVLSFITLTTMFSQAQQPTTTTVTFSQAQEDEICDGYIYFDTHRECLYEQQTIPTHYQYVTSDSVGEALVRASEKGKIDEVRSLLDAGVHVDSVDEFGNTALMQAARYNHSDIMALLVARGADPTLVNDDGETVSLIRALLQKDLDK